MPPIARLYTQSVGSKHVRTHLPHDDPRTPFNEATLGAAIFDETSEQLRLSTCVGQCERIKATPMTYGYIATLRRSLRCLRHYRSL